jgi:hypothetical protein
MRVTSSVNAMFVQPDLKETVDMWLRS